MNLGKRLAELRHIQGMTQKEFADVLNTSQSGYQNYERNGRDVPSSVFLTLYRKFGVDPIWLLTGERRITDEERLDALERAVVRLREILQKSNRQIDDSIKEARLIRLLYQYELKHGQMAEDQLESMINLAS